MAILIPQTTRRKTVCVESLPRVHCYLHLHRAQRRALIINIIGTIPAVITGTIPRDMGLRDLGRRALLSGLETRASRTRVMNTRLTSTHATGARVPEAGPPPGADGICAVRSEPIRVPNTTSRDPGRTTAATPAVLRWARLSFGAITSGRLSVGRTANGSSRAEMMVMRFEPGRGLWPAPSPSVTPTPRSRRSDTLI